MAKRYLAQVTLKSAHLFKNSTRVQHEQKKKNKWSETLNTLAYITFHIRRFDFNMSNVWFSVSYGA